MANPEIPEYYLENEFQKLKNKWKILRFLEEGEEFPKEKEVKKSENDFPISKLKEILEK